MLLYPHNYSALHITHSKIDDHTHNRKRVCQLNRGELKVGVVWGHAMSFNHLHIGRLENNVQGCPSFYDQNTTIKITVGVLQKVDCINDSWVPFDQWVPMYIHWLIHSYQIMPACLYVYFHCLVFVKHSNCKSAQKTYDAACCTPFS